MAGSSAVCYVLAFPGIGLWPLAFVALLPLTHGLLRSAAGPREALWLGLCFGVFTQLLGYSFLLGTLERFSGFPVWLCVPIVLLFGVYQGLPFGLWALVFDALRRRGRDALLLSPFVWVALELVYPQIFPTYFGNALVETENLRQGAELGGPMLLSWLLVALNAALYRGVVERRPTAGVWSLVVLCGLFWGYGHHRIAAVDGQMQAARERGATLRVGIVQANLGLHDKREDPAAAVQKHRQLSLELERRQRLDLLLWPETAVAQSLPHDVASVAELLSPLRTPVLFGALTFDVSDRDAEGRARIGNSALLAGAHGRVQAIGHKQRLVPFAERVPFSEQLAWLRRLSPLGGGLSPGSESPAFVLDGTRLTVLICYEDILPDYVRERVVRDRPQLLVNLTNDAWFGDTRAATIHMALSRLRAVEHRRALVRATNSGISALIDPTGRVVAETRNSERVGLSGQVVLLDVPSRYGRLGDWPGWVGLLVVALALGLPGRRQRERRMGTKSMARAPGSA
ncbi:MAG: apolipoprotein N-acyltransferase [Myxococcales bacterium]|nr:apolipoprotein N-acyltransferase [Myxococcales bacterium]